MNKIWHYHGPVYRFDSMVIYEWDAYTTAPTLGKALSNLQSRWKTEHKLKQTAKISLCENCMKEEETS